jgi:hypothetical protein
MGVIVAPRKLPYFHALKKCEGDRKYDRRDAEGAEAAAEKTIESKAKAGRRGAEGTGRGDEVV